MDNTKINLHGFGLSIDPSVTIDGLALSDLANDDGNVSYEDILCNFTLTEDIYTEEQHNRLMFNILASQFLGNKKSFELEDSFPKDISGRELLSAPDISPYFACELKKKDFPTKDPAFGLAVAANTKTNHEEISDGMYDSVVHAYLHNECIEHAIVFNRFQQYFNRKAMDLFGGDDEARAANLLWTVFHDPNHERVSWLRRSLEQMGCADLDRNKRCLEGAKSYDTVELDEDCPHLKEDAYCYSNAIKRSFPPEDDEGGNRKINTTTFFGRALGLQNNLEKLKDILPRRIERIMDVGAGLEITNSLCFKSGPAIYEPFAILNALAGIGRIDIDSVRLDIVDINPLVISHLNSMLFFAGSLHNPAIFDLAVNEERETHIHFAENLPGTLMTRPEPVSPLLVHERITIAPKVVDRLNPILGDITADRVADDQSYDLMVMFNVWQYLHPDEKWLALANITRLLKHGGVLLTDTQFEPSEDCLASGRLGLKKVTLGYLIFWVKE